MSERYWRIRDYKSLEEFFDTMIPLGSITAEQIKELLKCLAAKDGLTYNEIIGGYVKRKAKLANVHLDVQKNGPYPEYSCGACPTFIAIVVDKNGNRIEYSAPP
jgi:hypothetical protein